MLSIKCKVAKCSNSVSPAMFMKSVVTLPLGSCLKSIVGFWTNTFLWMKYYSNSIPSVHEKSWLLSRGIVGIWTRYQSKRRDKASFPSPQLPHKVIWEGTKRQNDKRKKDKKTSLQLPATKLSGKAQKEKIKLQPNFHRAKK